MAGRQQQRSAALEERSAILADLEELGLVPDVLVCPSRVRRVKRDESGNLVEDDRGDGLMDDPCGRPVLRGRLRCIKHRGEDMTFNQIVDSNEALKELRQYMANRLGPKAIGAIEDVLDDETASHGDRLNAAKTVLSRIGMAEGTKVEHEVQVTIVPPKEAMAAALAGVRKRLIEGGLLAPSHDEDFALPAAAPVEAAG